MVYFFKCQDSRYVIYMGEDKFENENLIKYAWPEDIWFHVDKFSSAHVYLRPVQVEDQVKATSETLKSIPEVIIEDMAQLTKENSIQGKKEQTVRIVYTPAYNLKKSGDMSIGEVGFKDMKLVKYTQVLKRNTEILNRLKKTKEQKSPDFKAELEKRLREERDRKRKEQLEEKKKEMEKIQELKKQKELKSYDSIFVPEKMKSNREMASISKTKQNDGDEEEEEEEEEFDEDSDFM